MAWALLAAVWSVPAWADQEVGFIQQSTEVFKITATEKGSVWSFTNPANPRDTISETLSFQQLNAARQALDTCSHIATGDLPPGRSIPVGGAGAISFQVQHEAAPPHKVYLRLGGHTLALDPGGQGRLNELVTMAMVAQKQMASNGKTSNSNPQSASFSNQDQQESDANRILHHWHGVNNQ
jgi:hypothetical protein